LQAYSRNKELPRPINVPIISKSFREITTLGESAARHAWALTCPAYVNHTAGPY